MEHKQGPRSGRWRTGVPFQRGFFFDSRLVDDLDDLPDDLDDVFFVLADFLPLSAVLCLLAAVFLPLLVLVVFFGALLLSLLFLAVDLVADLDFLADRFDFGSSAVAAFLRVRFGRRLLASGSISSKMLRTRGEKREAMY